MLNNNLITNTIKNLLISGNRDFYFLGIFLAEIEKNFTTSKSISTAALCNFNHRYAISFNEDFWNKLNEKERLFVILHEAEHYINVHFLMAKEQGWDHKLTNIAADLSINSILRANDNSKILEFPDGILFPENPMFSHLNLLSSQSTYYYYTILSKEKNKPGGSGNSDLDNLLADDLHPTWVDLSDLTEIEETVLRRTIQQSINESVAACKGIGNINSRYEGMAEEIKVKEEVISWKTLFRRFVGNSINVAKKSTWSKENRRFPGMPGDQHTYNVSAAFLSDSSGSVSDEDLMDCWGEAKNISNAGGKLFYASWDAGCDDLVEYKKGKDAIFTRTKLGGTNLNCALEKVNEEIAKKRLTLAIITTDGYIPPITVKVNIPILILITKDGSIDFDNPFNYKIIKL